MQELELGTADLARRLDIEQPRLRYYLNSQREPDYDLLVRICEQLRTSPDWILGVSEDQRSIAAESDEPPEINVPQEYIRVPIASIRAGMGGPGGIVSEKPEGFRYLPPDDLSGVHAQHDDLWIIKVYGPSMEPFLQNDDFVMVDIGNKTPSPPGVFVVWDGSGYVCKFVERVTGASMPMVRLISENPRFRPTEHTFSESGELDGSEAYILGRVVWMQRKM